MFEGLDKAEPGTPFTFTGENGQLNLIFLRHHRDPSRIYRSFDLEIIALDHEGDPISLFFDTRDESFAYLMRYTIQ